MSQLTTDPTELSRMARRVVELKLEHRDLDTVIAQLQSSLQFDELAIKRLKKRKLQLKDQIDWLEREMTPDEPA
ncbi:MAG: YdcH family protein [Xanthomonadaceae bacterium]|nr:YdcH family protein [Xanthomonadaceae bacterium]